MTAGWPASIAAAKVRLRRSSSIRARYCCRSAEGAFVRLHDRRAKLHAGAAEKFEIRAAVLPRIEPVDFTGDPAARPIGRHCPASRHSAGSPDARHAACWHATPSHERSELIHASLERGPEILAKTSAVPAFDRAGDILIADPAIALATSAFAASASSTIGRRVVGDMKPSRHSAYFRAAGLSLERPPSVAQGGCAGISRSAAAPAGSSKRSPGTAPARRSRQWRCNRPRHWR